jgi:transposase
MVEKAKILTLSQAKKSEYGETGKYVKFTDEKGRKAFAGINHAAIEKDLKFAGYNLLVTSETELTDLDIYNTYSNLWRIEESFRIMKSDLDARPVFHQKKESIQGHFLICYIAVLLERIFQFKILDDKYSSSEIFRFIKNFNVVKEGSKYINTTAYTDFIDDLARKMNLPLTNYYLSETQIKRILSHKI